jgi:hypothetical protein
LGWEGGLVLSAAAKAAFMLRLNADHYQRHNA